MTELLDAPEETGLTSGKMTIWLEKENIYRGTTDIFLALVAALAGFSFASAKVPALAVVLFLFASVLIFAALAEFKDLIEYDKTHFTVRTILSRETVHYSDITKVSRTYIPGNLKSSGHFRWYVYTKNKDGTEKKLSVPFPLFTDCPARDRLFDTMRLANPQIKWNVSIYSPQQSSSATGPDRNRNDSFTRQL